MLSYSALCCLTLCTTALLSHSPACYLTWSRSLTLSTCLSLCLMMSHMVSNSHSVHLCVTGLPLPHDVPLCPHSVHLCVTGLPLPHDVSLCSSLAHAVSCCLTLDHDYGSSSLCLVLHLNLCCSQLVCGFTNLLGLCASLLCNKSSCGWHGASPDSIAVPDLRLLSSDRVEWRRGWRRRSAATAQLQTDMADGREQDFKFHTTERHNVHFCWKNKVVKYRWTDLKHFLCSSVERYFS